MIPEDISPHTLDNFKYVAVVAGFKPRVYENLPQTWPVYDYRAARLVNKPDEGWSPFPPDVTKRLWALRPLADDWSGPLRLKNLIEQYKKLNFGPQIGDTHDGLSILLRAACALYNVLGDFPSPLKTDIYYKWLCRVLSRLPYLRSRHLNLDQLLDYWIDTDDILLTPSGIDMLTRAAYRLDDVLTEEVTADHLNNASAETLYDLWWLLISDTSFSSEIAALVIEEYEQFTRPIPQNGVASLSPLLVLRWRLVEILRRIAKIELSGGYTAFSDLDLINSLRQTFELPPTQAVSVEVNDPYHDFANAIISTVREADLNLPHFTESQKKIVTELSTLLRQKL